MTASFVFRSLQLRRGKVKAAPQCAYKLHDRTAHMEPAELKKYFVMQCTNSHTYQPNIRVVISDGGTFVPHTQMGQTRLKTEQKSSARKSLPFHLLILKRAYVSRE